MNARFGIGIGVLFSMAAGFFSLPGYAADIRGIRQVWHTITLTFDGPETSETAKINPFTDYRLVVAFRQEDREFSVCGYYAADGNAAETSAVAGNKWRVHFVPDSPGQWSYKASFRTGQDIAMSLAPDAGENTAFDGQAGSFQVQPSDKTGRDFRGKGFLRVSPSGYLRFAGSGQYWIKIGADSPENLLAYADFDGTFDTDGLNREGEAQGGVFLHTYQPHVKDWRPGDPTWQGGKGKGLVGGLNYLADKGVNSVYFITYNLDGGDGKDVWPWIHPQERRRFDCSKLDQWEIVFEHMDKLGIMLHNISQEQENDQGLDKGELGPQRRLYYRELVARFGHHLGITWNLGEENTNTDQQRKAFAKYFHDLDPYGHPVVVHTFPGQYDQVYKPLLGYKYLQGPSLQTEDTHNQVRKWIDESVKTGDKWYVCLDEIGPADIGVKPDADDPGHDRDRTRHLWGALMGGAAGVEWYFGYRFSHNDLNCEDWRSRDLWWDQNRHAADFFTKYLPFAQMAHADERVPRGNYCLALPGQVYAVYLPLGGTTEIDLADTEDSFSVEWYDPRRGGSLQAGSVRFVRGPGKQGIGAPPNEPNKDWVILIKKESHAR
ncbi:MAG: DUF5060 domain-containing protein [Sedimentisphaerales bacterium]|nr:DUF5060 domain-containing protein [Sedimentisphaerales bacterium]